MTTIIPLAGKPKTKRKRPKVSKSKMGEAFKAQAHGSPRSAREVARLRARLEELLTESNDVRSALADDDHLLTARTWFYYGWQACERSKKP